MTAQEKWKTTIRCMELVRAHYIPLKEGRASVGRIASSRQLRRWLHAVERAHQSLKSRRSKSSARARRDWLAARVIELMIFEGAGEERIRRSLSGARTLHQRYVGALTEEAVQAVCRAAQEEGLFE